MDSNQIKSAAEIVEGIVKAVPLYQDVAQPAAKQIGKGLEVVAKTLHIALAPLSALVRGYEKISDHLGQSLTEKFKNIPIERIQNPDLLVAGPIIESLKFSAHQEDLRELYTNLLATSIDSETAKNAHPGFVQIIQSLSPDEAKIIKLFLIDPGLPLIDVNLKATSGGYKVIKRNFSHIGQMASCDYPELTPNYLDNLCRLGLLEIPSMVSFRDKTAYEQLKSDIEISELEKKFLGDPGVSISFTDKKIQLTDYGDQFCDACIISK